MVYGVFFKTVQGKNFCPKVWEHYIISFSVSVLSVPFSATLSDSSQTFEDRCRIPFSLTTCK